MYKPVPITTMNWVYLWSCRDRRQLKSKCSWEDGTHLGRNRQKEGSRLSTKIMRGREVMARMRLLSWPGVKLSCALQIKHLLQCSVWCLELSWEMWKWRIYLLESWTLEIRKIKLLIKWIGLWGRQKKVTSSLAHRFPYIFS